MSNIIQRTLSGAVYVGITVASILWDVRMFGVVFLLVTGLGVREYHLLVQSPRWERLSAAIGGGILFATLWINQCTDMAVSCRWYVCYLAWVLVAQLFLRRTDPIAAFGHLLVSQVMVALPFALMCVILAANPYLLLALFITIWVNDTGAYLVGSSTAKLPNGNHKMFPRVSPNKSWEGLIGGIVFALICGYIWFRVGWISSLMGGMAFALVVSVFGTLGDLMESLMKRTIGVKDSGKFLPGHGGVLDRFDSILLAIPMVWIFLFLFV